MKYDVNTSDPELTRQTKSIQVMVSNAFQKNCTPHHYMTSISISLFVNSMNALLDFIKPTERSKWVAGVLCAVEDGLLFGKSIRESKDAPNEG